MGSGMFWLYRDRDLRCGKWYENAWNGLSTLVWDARPSRYGNLLVRYLMFETMVSALDWWAGPLAHV